MNWIPLFFLLAVCLLLMLLERIGLPTTLVLNMKGDVKRESRWRAQYGQAVWTIVTAILIFQLDPTARQKIPPLLIATFGASIVATIIKRLTGRVRPNREHAGKFLGPTLRHANFRESFPSSHSASAVAMSAMLAHFYPPAAATFWTLAILCAALRYVLDANWPSDVVGGIAIGYAAAGITCHFFVLGGPVL